MHPRECPGRGVGKKLLILLRQLQGEAYQLFRSPGPGATFSLPLFSAVASRWGAWRSGIVPSRSASGRGAQSAWLLRAFVVLDHAHAEAQRDGATGGGSAGGESSAAFEARVLRGAG